MNTPSQAQVRRAIAEAQTIVVKVGSSSLTKPSGHLDPERLNALVAALARVRLMGGRVVLVSSGAIAAGFGSLGFDSRPTDVADQQACAAVGQGLLMAQYDGRAVIPVAEVCRDWEAATQPAAQKGIRVVNLRFGVILSKEGGALKKMLLPFKLGAGGVIGSGKQYFSWITLEDTVKAIEFALQNEKLKGPVNTVAPELVTNRQFTKALGRVLWRPTLFPMPASTARLAFGEMADEMLLASLKVKPVKLQQAGFRFEYPELSGALKHLL